MLHKCTLSIHQTHLLGNRPPHLQPRAAKHFAVLPAGTHRERGEGAMGTLGPITVHQACLPHQHPGGKLGHGAGTFGSFQATRLPLWSRRGNVTLGRGPGASAMFGSPAQRKHTTTDCHNWATPATWWNGPATRAGNPGPAAPLPRQGGDIPHLGSPQTRHPSKIQQWPDSATEGHRCSCSSRQSRTHPFQKAGTGCWPRPPEGLCTNHKWLSCSRFILPLPMPIWT